MSSENVIFKSELNILVQNNKINFRTREIRTCRKAVDGRSLIKIFGKCVKHRHFSTAKSKKEKGEKCLRFEIGFDKSEVKVRLSCCSTTDQPGNGHLEECGTYAYYDKLGWMGGKLENFYQYFEKFLQHPIKPPKKDGSASAGERERFEISLLLAYEIARRLPEHTSHTYHDVPVAAAIFMAIKLKLPLKELFDVFRGTKIKRMEAFQKIVDKYKSNDPRVPTANELIDKFWGQTGELQDMENLADGLDGTHIDEEEQQDMENLADGLDGTHIDEEEPTTSK